jgi:hypothetical protein
MAVVVDVANVEGGLPYGWSFTRDGKPFFTGKGGETGSFDATPTRIEFSFRKARPLPDGAYVFRLVLDGDAVATGKVRRACNG